MSLVLVAAVTLAYLGTAISLCLAQRWGFCIMFTGYFIANIGVLMEMK